jgi:hypothetical protein
MVGAFTTSQRRGHRLRLRSSSTLIEGRAPFSTSLICLIDRSPRGSSLPMDKTNSEFEVLRARPARAWGVKVTDCLASGKDVLPHQQSLRTREREKSCRLGQAQLDFFGGVRDLEEDPPD